MEEKKNAEEDSDKKVKKQPKFKKSKSIKIFDKTDEDEDNENADFVIREFQKYKIGDTEEDIRKITKIQSMIRGLISRKRLKFQK